MVHWSWSWAYRWPQYVLWNPSRYITAEYATNKHSLVSTYISPLQPHCYRNINSIFIFNLSMTKSSGPTLDMFFVSLNDRLPKHFCQIFFCYKDFQLFLSIIKLSHKQLINVAQIVSGRHRQVTYVLHRSIGAAVESVNRWRRLNMCTQNVVKEMEPFGVLYSKFISKGRWFFFLVIRGTDCSNCGLNISDLRMRILCK